MSILRQILGNLSGDVHFYVTVGDKPVAEVILRNKVIVIDIKDPLLAAKAAFNQLLSKPKNQVRIEKLRKLGFVIKIKYKMLEMEL